MVLRSDLEQVYRDPRAVAGILAYIPELHASSKCTHALKGGERVDVPAKDPCWCEWCTTDDPERATLRRTEDGWQPVGDHPDQ